MAESSFPEDDGRQFLESMGFDSDSDESELLNCSDPAVLKYHEEIAAYEGFYVTESEYLRKTYLGGCHPCDPYFADMATAAAECAIEHYNTDTSEALKLEEVIRSNLVMSGVHLWFITFRASNGKFYETKAWVDCRGTLSEFFFLRPAKHYPNLGSSSSESD